MTEKDIISFKDFLGKSLSSKSLEILSKIDFEEDVENFSEQTNEDINIVENQVEEEEVENVEKLENNINQDTLYTLYTDKNENFVCDIHIEGASIEKSQARLIIELNNWNIMIDGKLENGKCIIPVKNLSMLEIGQTGLIKLEVIAEGNVFTPWENRYRVEKSKDVFINFR